MEFNTYLFFNGRCEEAFKFYEKLFGGKIQALLPYGDMAKDAPSGDENLRDKILHGALKVGDTTLMGSDSGAMEYGVPKGFRVAVTMKTPAEAERVFAGLSDGANVTMPLTETFFSPRFGQLTDKFGIPWMVNCEQQGSGQ